MISVKIEATVIPVPAVFSKKKAKADKDKNACQVPEDMAKVAYRRFNISGQFLVFRKFMYSCIR